jgi:hypothetical protein
MFKAVVLEILVEVALMAVQNNQPVYSTMCVFVCMSKCFSHSRPSTLLVQLFSETESFQLRGIEVFLYYAVMWMRSL